MFFMKRYEILGSESNANSLIGRWELVSIDGHEPWGDEYSIEFHQGGLGIIENQFSYASNPPQISWFATNDMLQINLPWHDATIETSYSIEGLYFTRVFF